MKIKWLVILVILATSLNLTGKGNTPVAVKGVIDLREIEKPDYFILKLNGEWEFYWDKMLRPHDFAAGNIKPDFYGNILS